MKSIVQSQFRRDQRFTILIIGDDLGPLKRIAFGLQHRSHTVLWARHGRDALRSVRLESPDLVVCDVELPDISGFDVCRMVKSAFLTKTPVVLVARTETVGVATPEALKAGADDTIIDLSDTRYILAKLEWLASRSGVSRDQSAELTGSTGLATSGNGQLNRN